MNKKLWELEVSTDIKERILFVKKIKERIAESEKMLANNDPWHGVDRDTFLRLSCASEDEDIRKLAQEIIINMDEYRASDTDSGIIKHERNFLNMLKDKLLNYDVYNQQIKHICARCRETQRLCVCEEV